MVSFAVGFARETWSLYAIGVVAVVLRFIARIRRLSWRGLQIDDAIMVFALVWYTILVTSLNQVASGGGSNLMTQDDMRQLTPETHDERVRGSKWVFVSEHAMVLTIWSLKFCMLIIYGRITEGLQQKYLVYAAAIYTGLCLVGSELALFLSCRPLPYYWAVPTPDYQCSSYQHYEIAEGVMTITSDIVILLVAMPILVAVRLPPRQKIILLFLFGLGIFDIIASILTKIYCLVPSLISYTYMKWYTREACVAILVTNLPLTWSLFRDIFPGLKRWANSGESDFQPHSWPKSSRNTRGSSNRRSGDMNLQSFDKMTWNDKDYGDTQLNTSQERINGTEEEEPTNVIHVRSDVTLDVEKATYDGSGYPVWDWNGNPHHVSSTEVAAGRR